jgi:DNA-binding transcriptional MerR regulator
MERKVLQDMGLTKEQIDTIMAENGKDVEAVKTTLTAKEQELTTSKIELQGTKDQLKQRDTDIAELKKQAGNSEELNKQLTTLQGKYDTDTKALETKLSDQSLDFATQKFFSDVPFASELARKAAVADFKTKGFKYEGGKFIGADGYVAELKKSDPAAFKPEKDPEGDDPNKQKQPQGAQHQPPQFSKQITNNQGADGNPSGKASFFSGGGLNFVRQPPQPNNNQGNK